MHFSLTNFGRVVAADVRLDGITVIAGPNGSGKSTIGRALYTWFTSLRQFEREIPQERAKAVSDEVKETLKQNGVSARDAIRFLVTYFTPPIYTFLEANDLSGKVVVPFCTYGSGGRKASSEELKTLEPNANVTLAYGISNKRINAEGGVETAKAEVAAFFADLETGKTEEMLMGGFSKQRPLTAEDSAAFAEGTKDYAYLGLKPLSVSTQVVAGMNYLFVCEMKAFGGPAVQTNVKIFKPLPGRGETQLISVEK